LVTAWTFSPVRPTGNSDPMFSTRSLVSSGGRICAVPEPAIKPPRGGGRDRTGRGSADRNPLAVTPSADVRGKRRFSGVVPTECRNGTLTVRLRFPRGPAPLRGTAVCAYWQRARTCTRGRLNEVVRAPLIARSRVARPDRVSDDFSNASVYGWRVALKSFRVGGPRPPGPRTHRGSSRPGPRRRRGRG